MLTRVKLHVIRIAFALIIGIFCPPLLSIYSHAEEDIRYVNWSTDIKASTRYTRSGVVCILTTLAPGTHINAKAGEKYPPPPLTIELAASSGIRISKNRIVARNLISDSAEFKIPFQLTSSSNSTNPSITIHAVYFVCSEVEGWCKPESWKSVITINEQEIGGGNR